MKSIRIILMAAAGAAMVSSARAQFYTANDLILGVRSGSATNDIIVNLGNANTSVGANGSLGSVVNLSGFLTSGDLTSFGSAFQIGVVGGQPLTGGRDLYVTVQRSALGIPTVAGSLAPSTLSSSIMANGVGDISQMVNDNSLSAGQKATPGPGTPSSWSTLIAPGNGASGQFINDTGLDPMGTANGGVIREDLYRAVPNGQFAYLGYFTLDNSGVSPSFSFTVVPEPSTSSMLAAGGLAALVFARRTRPTKKQVQPSLS